MKLVMFGATGRTGSEIVRLALADGHEIKALVREPDKCITHPRLTVIQGDARNKKDVIRILEGADAVVSALGTDRTTTLTEAIPSIIEGMQIHGVSRIVTVGTAGILQSRYDFSKLRYQAGDSNRKLTFAAEEHHKVYNILSSSALDWTIVCPTYLPDGEATGHFRVEQNLLPVDGKQITTGDTAAFIYSELLNKQYIGFRVGIAE